MDYLSRVPSSPLDALVDDLYTLTGTPVHPRLNVPPMPSAHLMINLGGPVRLTDPSPTGGDIVLADGWFMGLWSRRFIIEHRPPVEVVGVHFKPWGLAAFVDLSLAELRDGCVPADAIWGRSFHSLRDRIAATTDTTRRLQVLEDALRQRLAVGRRRRGELTGHVGGRIAVGWGRTPIAELAHAAGVSGNRLATQFTADVGLTPKKLSRVYRFARFILTLDPHTDVDLASRAADGGYFDQAHLCREFKQFTGHTPTEFLALRRRFPARPGFPPDDGPMPAP